MLFPLAEDGTVGQYWGLCLKGLTPQKFLTITFGVPGQLDYDIGLKVAKWAGVNDHAIDLRTIDFSWDKILDSVKKSPWTYVPDGYFNQLALRYSLERTSKHLEWILRRCS
jgi:pyruvate/2-oxoglutarate/acetoin dehydrogenase E1 component